MNATKPKQANVQPVINQAWLNVLAFGMAAPIIQIESRREAVSFEVLP